MRLPLLLLGFAAVFATAALGEDDCRCWTPDAAQIAAAEAKIGGRPLPLGGLDRYARYYAGTIDSGRRFIRGKLVPAGGNEAPGIHIVEGRMLPLDAAAGFLESAFERAHIFGWNTVILFAKDPEYLGMQRLQLVGIIDDPAITHDAAHQALIVEGELQ